MREPLPNELLMEAWNAMVGAESERCFTQRAFERVSQKKITVSKSNSVTRRAGSEKGREELLEENNRRGIRRKHEKKQRNV
jgi:hypothetical protein